MRALRITYWICTLVVTLPMLLSGFLDILGSYQMGSLITLLGYPRYLLPFLGVAYFLGAAAIISDVSVLLKEWAYAGFTFNFLGASYSHFCSADPARVIFVPLGFLVLLLISYRAWKILPELSATTSVRRPGAAPRVQRGPAFVH